MPVNNTAQQQPTLDQAPPQVGSDPLQPTINIVDIQNAVKVIDHAADQGAFKGWETINQVSILRNRLDSFVQAALPALNQETAADAVTTSTPLEDSPSWRRKDGKKKKDRTNR